MSSKPKTDEQRALEAIRAHPWAALLGAAALGFLVARMLRGER